MQQFKIKRTGNVFADDFDTGIHMHMTVEQNDIVGFKDFNTPDEYQVTLSLGVTLRSNPVMLDAQIDSALKGLLHELHKDTIGRIRAAERAVYDGDRDRALVQLGKALDTMTDPTQIRRGR